MSYPALYPSAHQRAWHTAVLVEWMSEWEKYVFLSGMDLKWPHKLAGRIKQETHLDKTKGYRNNGFATANLLTVIHSFNKNSEQANKCQTLWGRQTRHNSLLETVMRNDGNCRVVINSTVGDLIQRWEKGPQERRLLTWDHGDHRALYAVWTFNTNNSGCKASSEGHKNIWDSENGAGEWVSQSACFREALHQCTLADRPKKYVFF